MRSQWITHHDRQIFLQDFSGHYLTDIDAIKEELAAVQQVVVQQPKGSVLVLSDFRNTQIGRELMDQLVASSKQTKPYVKKTAVLGVVGTKRVLGDMLIHLTGQQLTLFDDLEVAKDWLIKD
jgi:hypothetical protein